MAFTEPDAVAELTASYRCRTAEDLYAERSSLPQESESARERTESRLCADHLAVLESELTQRGLSLEPSAISNPAA
jgi:hypothetical protein